MRVHIVGIIVLALSCQNLNLLSFHSAGCRHLSLTEERCSNAQTSHLEARIEYKTKSIKRKKKGRDLKISPSIKTVQVRLSGSSRWMCVSHFRHLSVSSYLSLEFSLNSLCSFIESLNGNLEETRWSRRQTKHHRTAHWSAVKWDICWS